jgi:hypothetical protein
MQIQLLYSQNCAVCDFQRAENTQVRQISPPGNVVMKKSLIGSFAIFVCLAASVYLVVQGQDENKSVTGIDRQETNQESGQLPQGTDRPRTRPDDPDAIARRDYMRVKLMFTQDIVEGLVQKDFAMIAEAAKQIRQVTEGAAWNAVDSDEYRFQSREFQRTTDDLIRAADGRNIDATTMRFFALTTKCVDCHEHLRRRSDF